ncbi:hypothetical protein F5Y09DRAFT_130738 [Xylaria sp. FL1042]|nr:hypothetical protein F5Y09DRAFT_130738 [Xylaria sp. FL1042]
MLYYVLPALLLLLCAVFRPNSNFNCHTANNLHRLEPTELRIAGISPLYYHPSRSVPAFVVTTLQDRTILTNSSTHSHTIYFLSSLCCRRS